VTKYTGRFEEILREAVEEALREALGLSEARALKFYVDPSVIMENPAESYKVLERLFGAKAKLIAESVRRRLCELLRIENLPTTGFEETINAARYLYLRRGGVGERSGEDNLGLLRGILGMSLVGRSIRNDIRHQSKLSHITQLSW